VAAGAGVLPAPALLVATIRRHDIQFVALDASDLRLVYGLAWSPERYTDEVIALVQASQQILRTR
jgi:hypothetical protein